MSTASVLSLLFIGLGAAGCSGHTLDVGTSNSQAANGAPGSTLPANLQELCDAAHGTADPPSTPLAFKERLAGRWLRCDGSSSSPWTTTGKGIELVPSSTFEGQYYALDVDSAGTATRLTGLDSQGTYNVYMSTASTVETWTDDTPFGAIWVAGPSYASPSTFEFEKSPRRMRSKPYTEGTDETKAPAQEVWYVSLDER